MLTNPETPSPAEKRPYTQPTVTEAGTVEQMTQGNIGGNTDAVTAGSQ